MGLDTSKIIHAPVGGGRYTVTAPIVKEDYGLYLKIEGLELPSTYEVDFSNDEHSGSSVTMIGNADGVLIPRQFITTGKDVFAFLYHVGADYGRTVYKFRIPNKLRPDRTEDAPTPEEQSVIDQTIAALNDAVEEAEGYAQTASDKADSIHDMTATAQTLPEGSEATASYDAETGVMSFGIPVGATGAQGAKGDKGDKGDTGAQGIKGDKGDKGDTGAIGAKGDKGDKGDTGAQGIQGIQGEKGEQGIQGEKGEKGDKGDKGDTGEVTTEEFLKAFVTDSASGSIASFPDGADDIPLKSLIVNIDPVQDTSGGDPSPENICPISGWTGMQIQHTGKNLLPLNIWELPYNRAVGNVVTPVPTEMSWTQEDGKITYVTTSTYTNVGMMTPLLPAGTYYFTLDKLSSGVMRYSRYVLDKSFTIKEMGSSSNISSHYHSAMTLEEDGYIAIKLDNGSVASQTLEINVQIAYGDVETPYENYVGQTIPISWQTEAGTVYGGKLDVLSGVMRVYPYYASYNGETLTGRWISDRDVYAVGTTPTIGAQVVNIGAEGTEIQLEPHEVATLLGQNNIFADTGDSSVEYRADTKLYIEKLTQPTEDDMVANSAITSGQFFMIGNSLYKALANIASGATITVGTNAQRVSLADALNLVNA